MEFLTVTEIAQMLKTSPEFIYKNRRLFGGIKVGRLVRFPKQVFEAFIQEVVGDGRKARNDMEVRLHEEGNETLTEGILQRKRPKRQKPKQDCQHGG